MRRIADLPGPSGLPLLGNLLQVDRNRIHRDVERWAREHGPLFRFAFGRRHILGVADHELLNTLLRDRPDGFRRTRQMELISREMGLTPGLFGSNGDAWRHQRRMVMAGLDPNHVREYFPSLLKVTQRLHGRWQQAARAGTAIELQPDLMRFTVDAIAGLAFGADINTLESDADIIQRHLDKIFPALFKRMLSLVPVWRWRRSKADRELEQSVAAVNVAISGFIAQARARLAADAQRRSAPPNLLESMIVAADSTDSGVTDVQVAGNVMTMLLAGEDTTANTLAWMIYLLHRHPEALQRARAEVLAVAGSVEHFDPQRMAGLDYLEACAHETMRLKPVAPFQAVEALRDTTIADVQVPRGTIVWCVMRADSISDAHFPDAAAFKPERWLGDGAAASPLSSAKRVSMPFGAGPRVCPGRYLALLEIKMAMAMLLAHFEIDTVATPGGGEPAEHMSFTMSPLGLSMRLREGTRSH
jgi:cytochrome P450